MSVGLAQPRVRVLKKKDLSEKKQSKYELPKFCSHLRTSLVDITEKTEDALIQSSNFHKNNLPGYMAVTTPSNSRCHGASADSLLLDVQSMRIAKEDMDEDSFSDRADSERIFLPPFSFSPLERNHKAEEIDPVYFDHLHDLGCKESEYYYPDILPPPFNSWDLQQMAVFVNSEGRSNTCERPPRLLEKYVDRIIQLEWLQMQTIQSEKRKLGRTRPQTAPSNIRALKSPEKSKILENPFPSRQEAQQGRVSKLTTNHAHHFYRKKVHYEEVHTSYFPYQSSPKAAEVVGDGLSLQKQTSKIRQKGKKKKPREITKQQHFAMLSYVSNAKCQGIDNIKLPKQSPVFLSSAIPLKGFKICEPVNPKKSGYVNNK
ncbi:protein FAM217B isoform X2 [Tachyglossus aculeatus]|nr:protein FAM217B isoform X2 [Tachyglossus aculeatus]